MAEQLFTCASIADIEIPESGGSDFFKPEDGNNRIRFIAGPIVFFESQQFDNTTKKPIGDKKFYPYPSDAAKKDKYARLVFTYFIYDYSDKRIKQWNINTRSLQKTVQTINILNPDLSVFDCILKKSKGSNGFNEYELVSGQNSEFQDKEAIQDFIQSETLDKAYKWLEEKVAETMILVNNQEFEAKVENAPAQKVDTKDVEDIFDNVPAEKVADPFDK